MMSQRSDSRSSIMSVAECIDSAFGLPHENTVNHKLIQAVLFIMARQLKVLERQVEVVGPPITPSSSTLSITEVRLEAKKKELVSKISGVGVAGIKGVRATGPQGGKLRRGVRKRGMGTAIEEEEEEEFEVIHGERGAKDKRGGAQKTLTIEEAKKETAKGKIDTKGKGPQKIIETREDSEKAGAKTKKQKKGKRDGGDSSPSSETSSQKSLSVESTTDRRSDKKDTKQPDKADESELKQIPSTKISTDELSSDRTKSEKSLAAKTVKDKTSLVKTTKAKLSADESYHSEELSSDKAASDKSTSEKISHRVPSTGSPEDKISSKTKLDKSSKPSTPSIDTTSEATSDTSIKEPSEADKTSSRGDKASLKTLSAEKTASKSSVQQQISSTDKASMQRESATDKALMQREPSIDKTTLRSTLSAEKTSLKITPSTEDAFGQPTSSSPEIGTDKAALDRSASEQVPITERTSSFEGKISASKTKASTDQTGIDKTPSDKSIGQRILSTDKTTSQQSMTEKGSVKVPEETLTETLSVEKIMASISPSDHTSSAKTSTSRDKTTIETKKGQLAPSENSESDRTSTGKGAKSTPTKTTTDTSKGKGKGRLHRELLEALEEKREKVLRIIRQRADSREEYDKSPTPMASLDKIEAEYEKLLVVERVSSKEAREREKAARKGKVQTPKLSIVTQEEFDALAQTVRRIQAKYKEVGRLELPENAELMHELRKGASLTDAMGALQLSARLEAAEKTLQNMMKLVTDLASKTPGIDLTTGDGMEVLYGSSGAKAKSPTSRKASVSAGTATPTSKKSTKSKMADTTSSEDSLEIVLNKPASLDKISVATTATVAAPLDKEKDRVTFFELDEALQKIHNELMEIVEDNKTKNTACAEKILRQVKKLEIKLNKSLELGDKMNVVESLVAQYAEKINALDTGLSSQMTNYQEELTQMQHDLETGLDTMAEVLANAGTDTTAITELNTNFSNLQADIENTMYLQKDLQDRQSVFAFDLTNLREQIETLRDEKSDRDEVADALRDKAGLSQLNGLVSSEQFDAVRGDFEKRILVAYDKFNNQEAYWQKIIDDLLRDLNDKADIDQVKSLQSEVTRNVKMLTEKINAMVDIVGEPRASAVSRKLHRDEACLSCATPAHLEPKAPHVHALPGLRPPAIGAEAPRPVGHGDYEPCYPGKPIPHPIDPRAHICKRWCGGSHTAIPTGITKAPAGITLSTIVRDTNTTVGTDGKVYQTDEVLKVPCKPCKIHQPPPVEPETAKEAEETELKVPSTVMDECTCFPACGLWYR